MTQDLLVQLRHDLHKIPEVSGEEQETAAFLCRFLSAYSPDELITGLGGHGVAAVFDGRTPGPTVLIRCELDGLPIEELSDLSYRSQRAGRGHLCGHDGHMAMVAGLAMELHNNRPAAGRVVLLFQPAEETGKGASAVIADPRFEQIAPDFAFSLHNLPGLPIGEVALCLGPANCASRGMRIRLQGRTSHAAAPQDGVSPAGAIVTLLPALVALANAGELGPEFALVTVTHVRLGEATFGIAPGEAEIWVTLRTVTDARMTQLIRDAEALVTRACAAEGLVQDIAYDDVFDACTNHPDASARIEAACGSLDLRCHLQQAPQRWSEDFGQFGKQAKAAMFWLGSGEDQPQLHNPDFDFPDAALPVGLSVFRRIVEDLTSGRDGGNIPAF
jgi:amidohydrolase